MLQLAIECSGTHGSLAIHDDTSLVGYESLPKTQNSVRTLAACISTMLKRHALQPDFLSVTQGPGSFTGLRVGLATVKMLAWAWKIPIIPVDTLEVIADQMRVELQKKLSIDVRPASAGDIPSAGDILIPAINAFRGQVFSAAWRVERDGRMLPYRHSQVVDAGHWGQQPLESLVTEDLSFLRAPPASISSSTENQIYIGGPALKLFESQQLEFSGRSVVTLQEIEPDARALARIGWLRFQAGSTVSPEQLTALYLRKSAAEEKLPKKGLDSNSN